MLDMSSIMPIFTTPSEIVVFSSACAANVAANNNPALDAIISNFVIVTFRVVDAFKHRNSQNSDTLCAWLAKQHSLANLLVRRHRRLLHPINHLVFHFAQRFVVSTGECLSELSAARRAGLRAFGASLTCPLFGASRTEIRSVRSRRVQ
jgi:hypothetical protein